MIFSKSEVQKFYRESPADGRRLGQRFYDYFELDKIQNSEDRRTADRIYVATDAEATLLIDDLTDLCQ